MTSRRKPRLLPGLRMGADGAASPRRLRAASRRAARRAAVPLALVTLLGCASPPATEPHGLTKDEVCERFLQTADGSETVEVSAGDPSPRTTTASSAQQHRETARQLAEFGASARDAADPELSSRARRLEQHARDVVRDLPPDADDEEAQQAAQAMFTESIALYYDCVTHLLGPLELPTETTSGACAEPDAPTLDGPNVVHYGSGGHDFSDSTCELVQGTHTDGGCSFPGSATTSGDGQNQVFAVVEVAYDPDTCQALHEVGTIDPDDLPSL